jgi:hypothetical protein
VHANDWHFFRHFLHEAQPPYTTEEMDRYIEARSQPGAATGMINYYRSPYERRPRKPKPRSHRVGRLPDASHWVHHDDAERVNQLLTSFFGAAQPR